ncbi:MAG TPA: hypothetical protein VM791_16575 [Vicinamibacterales bacterium]|jgi:hypothetical protein|nr:hypothetical protein [Vicinamibacterales bacterium]
MKAVICPFCGVVSDGPHESQQACIAALQSEIDQTRRVLHNVTEPLPSASIAEEKDPQLT